MRETFPYIFEPTVGDGLMKREPGMPGGGGDPRNSTMSEIVVVDVRWGWFTCEWITTRQAQCMVLTACPWADKDSAKILGIHPKVYADEIAHGFRELANWLNATPEQREERHVWA